MKSVTVAFSSETMAYKGVNALSKVGIGCRVTRLMPGDTKRGCGFGVRAECDREQATRILRRSGVRFGEVLEEDCHIHRGTGT